MYSLFWVLPSSLYCPPGKFYCIFMIWLSQASKCSSFEWHPDSYIHPSTWEQNRIPCATTTYPMCIPVNMHTNDFWQIFGLFYLTDLWELLQALSLSRSEDRWHSWPVKSALNERINSASLKREIVDMETHAVFWALEQGFVNFSNRWVLPSFQGFVKSWIH